MSQASRSTAVDIDDMDELEMRNMGHGQSSKNRRSTAAVIRSRNRRLTHEMGHSNFNRTYLKMKKLNQEIGLRRVWNVLIKVVEDKLGADATAYFSIVAWLSWMLIPSIIIVLGFLLVPQMYYRFVLQNPSGYAINDKVVWHDFFTGEGWLEKTELFEGYYTNATIAYGPAPYEMPIAYFVIILVCYLSFLLLLAKSYAKAISERYVEHDRRQADSRQQSASHIQRNFFCYWNFTICNSETAAVCRANILEDMKKFLKRDKEKRTGKQLFINIVSNVVITILIFGVSIGIFFAATGLKYTDFIQKFAISVMTSMASVIVPPILSLAQYWEKYQNRKVGLFVPFFRNFLLQTLLFVTFIFILFTRAVCFQHVLSKSAFPLLCKALVKESETDELQCWETWFGQEIYRWQVVDLISVFVLSLIYLCLRRLFAFCGLLQKPIVNVEQMVMHLFLTQCFTWFGMFASPLLPLIFLIKLILSFLWFRFLVTRCCRPSNEPWKSNYAMTFFRVTIFIGIVLSIGGMITAISILKPSKTCGPFVQYSNMIAVIDHIRQGGRSNAGSFISLFLAFFNSFGFNVFFTLVLLVFILLMRRTAQSKYENLKLLRNTIKSLTKDKVYYTKEIKKCEAENPYYMRTSINHPKDNIKRTPSGTSIRSEDAIAATFDPDAPLRSSGRNRSVEFAPLPSQSGAFPVENLAFVPESPVASSEADPSEDLPPANFQPSLAPEFTENAAGGPHEDKQPPVPPFDAASDDGPDDENQLIRKESDDDSNGVDSPFFAGNQHVSMPRSSEEDDYKPQIPLPDY